MTVEGYLNTLAGSPRRGLVVAGVLSLLGLLFLQLTLSVRQNSITWDEDDHIYAGYMSLKTGDFGLNPEHPPLVKMIAAIPLLGMRLSLPEMQQRYFKLEGFLGGKDFLFKNDAETMLFRARLAASVLALTLALLVFLATREMFGAGASFIALGLLIFDPTLLAHGAVVGTDVGLSCFLFATIYAFYRYVKCPSFGRIVVSGLAAGLALASKHTAILIFPMLIVLAIVEIARGNSGKDTESTEPRGKQALRLGGAIVLIGVLSLAVLWGFYRFRYSARPATLQLNPPLTELVKGLSRPNDVRLLSKAARFRVLPESYLYGLTDVRYMADFYTSFLLGKIYPRGIWYYFPVAFTIKSSLTFMVLFLLALWAIAIGKLRLWRETLFLTIPPAFYFMVAMAAGMNIGVRHILPLYVFLTVLIGGACWALISQTRHWVYVVIALLAFQAISVTRAFPAYLAYANELWGGPSQTYKYLTDSNADWAQQLKSTKRYLDARGVKDCWFVYFGEGVIDTGYYGIPCKPLPTADSLWTGESADAPPAVDGPVLISAGNLSGFEFGPGALNPYEQFKYLKPTAVIDYSVFVFDGHFEIPLAASLGHSQKAEKYLREKNYDQALAEALQAAALGPLAVKPQALLGDIYTALDKKEEAKACYAKGLFLARTVEPEFQRGWAGNLQTKLARK